MRDDLTDQLRRYGAALEEHLDAPPAAVVDLGARRPRRFLAPAAAAAAVALVVAFLALARDGDDVTVPVTTDEKYETSTTTSTTSTSTPDAEPRMGDATTTTTIEESSPSSPTPVPPTTTSSTTPPTSTGSTTLTGTATWIGRDPRATIRVAACPTNDTATGCPSGFTVPVADDGTFTLTLRHDPMQWRLAASVSALHGCIFTCTWPSSPTSGIRSQPMTVDLGAPPDSLSFSVTARVVDVFVRDRNGDPFEGGGVMVEDVRCKPDHVCPEQDTTMMFAMASSNDGLARLLVDPNLTYEFTALARNTGWPGDPWVSPDGNEFYFSNPETMSGSAIDEGHTFYIQAAPSS